MRAALRPSCLPSLRAPTTTHVLAERTDAYGPARSPQTRETFKHRPTDVISFMIGHLQDVQKFAPTPEQLASRPTTIADMGSRIISLEGSLDEANRKLEQAMFKIGSVPHSGLPARLREGLCC